jgi:hypothetical protein
MQALDQTTRRELIEAGELYGPHLPKDWYHPRMAAVHRQNSARMREIVEQHGWPGRALIGDDGCEAAWQIVQHAIVDPELQQRAVALIEAAVATGEAPAWQWAMLTDRVLMEAGQPQRYGSILVGGVDGALVPWPIADADTVNVRRQAAGLPPLNEHTQTLQARVNLEAAVQQAATSAESAKIEP